MSALNEAFPEGLYSVASAKVHHLLVREQKKRANSISELRKQFDLADPQRVLGTPGGSQAML